jgi:hypothetical protein
MAFNGSDLINHPFNTTFSAYTHFFGMAFFIIPIAFIGAALFLKTRDIVLVSIYFMISSAFLMVGSAGFGETQASLFFFLIMIIGVATLVYGVFYGGK